jgi:hypothetical protein
MGSLFPVATIVFRVGHYSSNVDTAFLIDEPGNQPVSIAADVENHNIANQVCRREGSSNVTKAGEPVVPDEVVSLGRPPEHSGLRDAPR